MAYNGIGAVLQVILHIPEENRGRAVKEVYVPYREQFLAPGRVPGAVEKVLLVNPLEVQVLHGFATRKDAEDYLAESAMFREVAALLEPLWDADPVVRIYDVFDVN